MGRNVQKTIVIELNGCCGCGKSTLVAALGRELEERGIRYAGKRELEEKNYLPVCINRYGKKKIYWTVFNYCCSIVPFRLERVGYVRKVVKLHNSIQSIISDRKYKVILLDEGIVQGLFSVAYMERISNRRIAGRALKILLNRGEYYIVNCHLNYNEISKRINKRKRNTGRVDQCKSNRKIKKLLKMQHYNLNVLRSLLPPETKIIETDMKWESVENAAFIIKQLELE